MCLKRGEDGKSGHSFSHTVALLSVFIILWESPRPPLLKQRHTAHLTRAYMPLLLLCKNKPARRNGGPLPQCSASHILVSPDLIGWHHYTNSTWPHPPPLPTALSPSPGDSFLDCSLYPACLSESPTDDQEASA